MASSKQSNQHAALIIPLAALGIPVLGILTPVLSQLIPLAYILSTIGMGTWAARHLMSYSHELKLEALEKQIELEEVQRRRLLEAERLLQLEDPIEKEVRRIEAKQSQASSIDEESDS